MATFFGEPIVKFHEVATAVSQTVCQDRVESFGQIPRKSVTHLHRRFQLCRTMLQNVRQIFAGMPMATEEQRDAHAGPRGNNA